MKKLIYAGFLAFTLLSVAGCGTTASERGASPDLDAAHKRNNRADYAEETQKSR